MDELPPLTVRTAAPADAHALGANHLRAYPMVSEDLPRRVERFEQPRFYPIETLSVVERAGVIVGQCRTIPFGGWFGGVHTKVGGLAGVAVAPEARRTGVAAALVAEHLRRCREEGDPWALLY